MNISTRTLNKTRKNIDKKKTVQKLTQVVKHKYAKVMSELTLSNSAN